MTKESMQAKLNRTDISGIGVEIVTANDQMIYYFYEDFEDNSGIDRAMKQLYPGLFSGKFKRLAFIEHAE